MGCLGILKVLQGVLTAVALMAFIVLVAVALRGNLVKEFRRPETASAGNLTGVESTVVGENYGKDNDSAREICYQIGDGWWVFTLMTDLTTMALLLTFLFHSVRLWLRLQSRFLSGVPVNQGYVVRIGKSTYQIRTDGHLHTLFCNQKDYSGCDCATSDWVRTKAVEEMPKEIRRKRTLATNDGTRFSIRVMRLGSFCLLFVDVVWCSDQTSAELAQEWSPVAMLSLAILLLLISTCVPHWSLLVTAFFLSGVAFVLHGIFAPREEWLGMVTWLCGSFMMILAAILGAVIIGEHFTGLREPGTDGTDAEIRHARKDPGLTEAGVIKPSIAPMRLPGFTLAILVMLVLSFTFAAVNADDQVTCTEGPMQDGPAVSEEFTFRKMNINFPMSQIVTMLDRIEEEAAVVYNFSVPVSRAFGGEEKWHKLKCVFDIHGRVGTTEELGGVIQPISEYLLRERGVIIRIPQMTARGRYYSEGGGSTNETMNVIHYEHPASTYVMVPSDMSICQKYPQPNVAAHSRAPGHFWSMFARHAKYCSTCVSLDEFNKWKGELEGELEDVNSAVEHISDSLDNVIHALSLVEDEVEANRKALLDSFTFVTAQYAELKDQRMQVIAAQQVGSNIGLTNDYYSRANALVNSILQSALYGGPILYGHKLLLASVQNYLDNMCATCEYEATRVSGSITNEVFSLQVSYKDATMRIPNVYARKILNSCWSFGQEGLTFIGSIAAVSSKSAPGAVAYVRTDWPRVKCRGMGCSMSGLSFNPTNKVQCDGGVCLASGSLGAVSSGSFAQQFGFMDAGNETLAFCAGECHVFTEDYTPLVTPKVSGLPTPTPESPRYRRITIKDGYQAIEDCDNCQFHMTCTTGGEVWHSRTLQRVGSAHNISLPGSGLSDAVFEHRNYSLNLGLPDDTVRGYIKNATLDLADAGKAMNFARQLLATMESYNFTGDGGRIPDLVSGIEAVATAVAKAEVTVVKGAVEALEDAVEGITDAALHIASSLFLTFLPYLLIALVLAVAIIWPIIYSKRKDRL